MGSAEPLPVSRLRGGPKIARGMVVSLMAVLSTAVAHHAVTGHAPEVSTLIVALAVTSPVCIALSQVPHSRLRLGGAVFAGQLFLHLLFTRCRPSAQRALRISCCIVLSLALC